MKLIAVSGVARSGKDTIANKLAKVIIDNNPSIKVGRYSFAEELKLEIAPFLIEKFNIDPFTAEGKDKDLIRPFLIAMGQARRNQTNGRHWIDTLEKKIKMENPDVAIISDLRFADTDVDELFWLKENKGKLIHVSRFSTGTNGSKRKVPPAGPDEKRNDPILKKQADFLISWFDADNEKDLSNMAEEFCTDFFYQNVLFLS